MGFRNFFNKSGDKKQPSPAAIDSFLHAAYMGDEKEVGAFCKKYPDHIDVRDEKGQTALMLAASRHKRDLCDILLKNGASPLLKNNAGKTARDQLQDLTGKSMANEEGFVLTTLLKKAEEEWASRPSSEWQGKVDPLRNTRQGH
jgi:hypothetical protein